MLVTELTPDQVRDIAQQVALLALAVGAIGGIGAHLALSLLRQFVGRD